MGFYLHNKYLKGQIFVNLLKYILFFKLYFTLDSMNKRKNSKDFKQNRPWMDECNNSIEWVNRLHIQLSTCVKIS